MKSRTKDQYYTLFEEHGLDTIDVIQKVLSQEEFIGALKFNVLKYTLRAGRKKGEPEIKDYLKARDYLDTLIVALDFKKPQS